MTPSLRWAWIARPGVVAVVGSVLAAEVFLASAASVSTIYGTGTFALWSIPLGVLVAALARGLRRAWGGLWLGWRALGALVAGLALGVAYAFAAYFASDRWVLAFEFPVLYCWAGGAVAGLVAGALLKGDP